jgi:pheromone shutdown protein TraB
MQVFKNLTLLGTSHVAIESVKQAQDIILSKQPRIVALELDKGRFLSLMQKKKREKVSFRMIRRFGVKGFLFSLIGAWIEEKIGKMVGVSPGSEMKIAAITAAKIKADIALIDQDIRITIKHLFKYITWKEKLRFIGDIIKGIILRKSEVEQFDLRKVPPEKIIKELLKKTKKRYPGFYKALVQERNVYMAKNLYKIMNKYKEEKIVGLVGAGHEKEMISLIKKEEAKQNV